MTALSVLDLAPIAQGETPAQALARTRELAIHAEHLGYRRYWLAEHHNMPGIASAATALVIGHVAQATRRIRVGAGGIMLPNHAPLVVAEQFGTLASLYPGRIDLGLGRAPGTDQATARALRRTLASDPNAFPDDVVELMHYFSETRPGQAVRAIPGEGLQVPIWILGSSLYGAQLAAMLGLPYAFASHFAPAQMMDAIAIYRERFQPSAQCETPARDARPERLCCRDRRRGAISDVLAPAGFHRPAARHAGPVATARFGITRPVSARRKRPCSPRLAPGTVAGGPETVRMGIEAFIARTGADEIMVTAQIFDQAARLRSFEIAARMHRSLAA